MGIGKKIFQVLEEVSDAIEKSELAIQQRKEKETLAHVRNEDHDEKYCEICSVTPDETEVLECQKHEFGECKANCRYRTGVVEDCTVHSSYNCAADCRHRRA